MKKNEVAYKAVVSILLGLLGFWLNFHPLKFTLPPNLNVTFWMGLVFPIIVAHAWGFRYALLSAVGGLSCLNGLFLWLNWGYVGTLGVVMWVMWAGWHGWCADRSRANGSRFNAYVTEAQFRVFYVVMMYTAVRYIGLLNPAPWGGAAGMLPVKLVHVLIIKTILNMLVVLLLADVLTSFKAVRKLLLMEEVLETDYSTHVVSAALLFGFVYWLLDGLLVSLSFDPGKTFMQALILDIGAHDHVTRLLFMTVCAIGGVVTSKYIYKFNLSNMKLVASEKALKEYSEKLEEMVDERTAELREAQETLVRKEKLAVMGELGGGISHELRNPLGAIKNATYFLRMVIPEPEPEVAESLEILEKEVASSVRIISSLLEFSRMKDPIRRKTLVSDMVEEVLDRTARTEEVVVHNRLGSLPYLLTDPDQMGIVFNNLIPNAIQAMPRGGTLTLSGDTDTPGWMAIRVTDTGEGIPHEHLNKLFEPLFTTKAKGIGLGLALTRALVRSNGGTIEVESELGKGSTFVVNLPIGSAA